MFRYLAIAWTASDTARSLVAARQSATMQAAPGWRLALSKPGLYVFVRGEARGINGVYPLCRNRGLIVGMLFHRGVGASSEVRDLTEEQALSILDQRGLSLTRRYWGRYVAFLSQGTDGDLDVLRDPSGTLPCYRLQREGVWLLCSWLEDALSLLPREQHPAPDRESVLAYLLLGTLTSSNTALSDVEQALPGERVEIRHDVVRREDLWQATRFAASPWLVDDIQAAEALRRAVWDCTRRWARCYERIVLRLSGGVDSSILATCLSAADTDAEVLCVNYRSSDPAADERPYARLAAAAAGRPLKETQVEADVRLEGLVALPRTPIPRSHVNALSMAQLDASVAAEFDAPAIFSGVGGDLLFFELHRSWPAADYLQVRGLDAGFLPSALDAARLGGQSLWQVIAFAARARWREGTATGPACPTTLLMPDARLASTNLASFQHPTFCDPSGLPPGKLNQLQQLLCPLDYYEPLTFDRGPEPVRPLLSQPLVELALSIPTFALTRGGQGRALARRAFADVLPPEIARRRTKGTTGRSVADILVRNRKFARDMLLDGELARMGLIDDRRVAEALSASPKAVQTPTVELNTLVSVEAWLRCWHTLGPSALDARRT